MPTLPRLIATAVAGVQPRRDVSPLVWARGAVLVRGGGPWWIAPRLVDPRGWSARAAVARRAGHVVPLPRRAGGGDRRRLSHCGVSAARHRAFDACRPVCDRA